MKLEHFVPWEKALFNFHAKSASRLKAKSPPATSQGEKGVTTDEPILPSKMVFPDTFGIWLWNFFVSFNNLPTIWLQLAFIQTTSRPSSRILVDGFSSPIWRMTKKWVGWVV